MPLQVIWAKRDQHRAIGTSLAAILPIAIVVGALVGSLAAQRVPDRALKVIVAILLFGAGLKELYDVLLGTAPHLIGTAAATFGPQDYALMTAGGLAIGVVSGLTGVGGGVMVVPLLPLGFGIGQRVAQGTSLIAMLPTAAIGALTHHGSGNVDVRAASWMAVAGVPAAVVGSALALWLPARAPGRALRSLPAHCGDADVARPSASARQCSAS